MPTSPEMIQCPRCWGRGYKPEARRNGGPGFYARNCPRCNGRGETEAPPPRTAVANEIRRGILPDGYELTAQDIGRPLCPREGFRRVLRADVGKRCYLRGGIFQMENAAQRDARRPIQWGSITLPPGHPMRRPVKPIADPAAYVQDGRTYLPPDSE